MTLPTHNRDGSTPVNSIVINYPPPQPRQQHVHRWAWAMMTDGAEAQVCYDCGKERA